MRTIRLMRDPDIAMGLELCRLAGWNQIEADWRRLLALEPAGVFVADEDGRACATASAVCYGPDAGWIGMILVHPDFRGRGIATDLMGRCVEYLQGKGAASIKLDATEQGRQVYLELGFADEQPIWRMAGRRPPEAQLDTIAGHDLVRPITRDDWKGLAPVDRGAFGAERTNLLKCLCGEGGALAAVASGQVRAFGFDRHGHEARQLGPVVGTDPAAASAVVAGLLAGLEECDVFWDLFPANVPSLHLARSLGFQPVRMLTRMCLGRKVTGRTDMVFAAAGFELG